MELTTLTLPLTATDLYHNNFYRSQLEFGTIHYFDSVSGQKFAVYNIDYFDDKNYIILLWDDDSSFIVNPTSKFTLEYEVIEI